MAGDTVLMSPVSQLMIHNPLMNVCGEASELEKGVEMLNEIKESIINAYQEKTGISRAKLSKMMDAETWMNAKAAMKLGFADGLLYGDIEALEETIFDRRTETAAVAEILRKKLKPITKTGIPIEAYDKRLSLILH